MPAMDEQIIGFLREHGLYAAALRVESAFEASAELAALEAATDPPFVETYHYRMGRWIKNDGY